MSNSSDTESEHEDLTTGWQAADYMRMSAQIDRVQGPTQVCTRDLREAIALLEDVDVCAIGEDQTMLEDVRHASGIILSFLTELSDHVQMDEHTHEAVRDIFPLLHDRFLAALFESRAGFHAIAARETAHDSSMTTIVCWADVILARLGQAIITAASTFFGVSPQDREQPQSVRAQKEDDMLRAALQLPETWKDASNILDSNHISSAAMRLMLSLLFGTHVMRSQLLGARNSRISPQRIAVHKMLQSTLKRMFRKASKHVTHYTQQDRLMSALFVSLYAELDMDDECQSTSFRPQLRSTLLEMIQIILHAGSLPSTNHPSGVIPVAVADAPLIILMKWGRTISWSWITWDDPRLSDAEAVEFLTATWLYDLNSAIDDIAFGYSVEYWDDKLVSALNTSSDAALSMLCRILFNFTSDPASIARDTLDPPVLDVTLKICWAIAHVFRQHGVNTPYIESLCTSLWIIFAAFPEGVTGLSIRDLVLEILSLADINPSTIMDRTEGSNSPIAVSMNAKLHRYSQTPRKRARYTETTLEGQYRAYRQMLQFMALVWCRHASFYFAIENTQQFLDTIFDLLAGESAHDSLEWVYLGDATIALLSVLWKRRDDTGFLALVYDDSFVWNLARRADPEDLVIAVSIAVYISVSAATQSCDRLLWAEAWSCLCDAMLLILTDDLEDADEPLALLVAPTICQALACLISHGDESNYRYCKSSPWSMHLATHLERLLVRSGSPSDAGYFAILAERVGPMARSLCDRLTDPYKRAQEGMVSPAMEPLFCWIRSLPCLLLKFPLS